MKAEEKEKITKELEQWAGTQSTGLGDTIAKVTKKLGIKKCQGCGKRQKKLNRLFPYRGS